MNCNNMNNSLEKQDQIFFLESPPMQRFVIGVFCFMMLIYFEIAYRNIYRYY